MRSSSIVKPSFGVNIQSKITTPYQFVFRRCGRSELGSYPARRQYRWTLRKQDNSVIITLVHDEKIERTKLGRHLRARVPKGQARARSSFLTHVCQLQISCRGPTKCTHAVQWRTRDPSGVCVTSLNYLDSVFFCYLNPPRWHEIHKESTK
ncbi:uncharacterized protein LOC143146949 [Ptiloglossa arizonensis]|uniref:uncharacterized protein LOC143146949 n=1 Tax=Ptiloglossa arizonensis TaxID=3350558 RepID=UPI003F9F5A8A